MARRIDGPEFDPHDPYSAATSIKQIAAVFGMVEKLGGWKAGANNLDVGGGKFDLATLWLAERGVRNEVLDPGNRSAEHNRLVAALAAKRFFDTATVSNVLNVIPGVDEAARVAARADVIRVAANALGRNGTAYFTVFEGDGSGRGRRTSKGWQANRKTADYVPEVKRLFGDVVRRGKLIVARVSLT